MSKDKAELFIDCRCELGEGPFWNRFNDRLYWFDILNNTLLSADASGEILERFTFDDRATAAAMIDANRLAVATAGALVELDLDLGTKRFIASLEADKVGNRPNDSRVHPAGGFWIGTMSRKGDDGPEMGAVYQYRDGQVELLFDRITIPNSICFSPDGRTAYFTDTPTKRILKRSIDPATGRPIGEWSLFAEVDRGFPDGSVVDSEGYLWNARWEGHCVVRHAPDGSIDRIVEVPTSRVTCPAFGGPDLKTLYITTAREHMSAEELAADVHAGGIFALEVDVPGLSEPLIKL